MTRYVLYKLSNGHAVSISSTPSNRIPPTMGEVATDNVGIWNPQTLDFDPYPVNRVVSSEEFIKRIGLTRFKSLKDGALVDPGLDYFVDYYIGAGDVDLDSADLSAELNSVVTAGVWTASDVSEILA